MVILKQLLIKRFSVAIIDFKINAKFDISYINSANFKKFILDYKNSNPDIISAPETAVITSFDNGMNLRIVFKTQIRKQNAIEPDFRSKLAEHLIKNNIRFENTVFVKMEEQKWELYTMISSKKIIVNT